MRHYTKDIAHCKGIGCPLAERCFRHELAIEAGNRMSELKQEFAYIPWVVESYKDGECPNYFDRNSFYTICQ